ncbi:TonB-dependent receptor [Sphingomonas sp. Tas61C01]|uniref:TonB-dependent receptor n=1 Tax=Sphingomonas sp. Tas61C01 TaxID=3458297 RepID=UPI00403E5357
MSLTLALLLAGQAATAPAAQTTPVPPDAAAVDAQVPDAEAGRAGPAIADAGGDIVVTARRRNETIQRVPIAMSVIGGTALAETGANTVGRLTQLQPSLQFYSTNPRNSAANIRGLGAPFGLTNDGIEQGVGIYVDQVYNSRIAAATFDFTDVDRVEILRGPQGTLYGKNTTAGAINVTSRAPSFSPEARGEITLGNLDYVQAKASVSGPLVDDKVAIRLSASVTSRKGTIYNVTSREYVNSQDNLSLRSRILWRAAPNLDLTLSGDYNYQNPDCCAQIYARVGPTQRPANRQYAALAAAFGYAPPSTDAFDRITDLDTKLRAKQELGGLSLLGEWDLGAGTLTSVTAWRFWNWNPSNDRDFTGLPITSVSANPSQQRQYSQELRFANNGTNRIDYVGGLFLFHQTIDTQGLQVQGSAASRWLLNPGASVPAGAAGCSTPTTNACNPAVLNGLRSENEIGFKNTSVAAFGKLTWHVTDRFSVQPGVRVNYDKKDGSYVSTVTTGTGSTNLNADQRGVLAPQSYKPSFDDWNLSGDLTLAYDLSDDLHAYATYARSFKSGGINLSGLPLDAANNPILSASTVKPETVNHYELGLKSQFLDRRATVNLAAFWTEIGDYQATVTNNQIGVLRGYLANAEKVRVKGIEIDAAFRPVSQLNLYANAAYTDAKYARFVDAPCPPELSGGSASPANCDISGQILPGTSKWAFSYGGEYNIPATVFGTTGQLYAGVDGSYRSKFSSNPSRSISTDIDGYALTNFRLGFRKEGSWNLFGWLRNAFDTDYFELLATQSGSTGLVVGQPGDPRTYGLTLSKTF